jgi:hypothetical protein
VSKKAGKWLKAFEKFISNLRIDSKHEAAESSEQGIELDLWDSQRRVLDAIGMGMDEGVHYFVVLKSRQLGVSTVTVAILLFWVAVHNRINAAFVIDNDENSAKFRAMIVKYMDSFPKEYFGKAFKITKNNSKFIEFSNGSAIDFLVAGKSKTTWGESRAYTCALLSEVAKYGKAEGLNSFKETLSETNPIRLYILESTGHGINHWKNEWDDAGADPYTKRRIFVGWWSSRVNRIETKDPRFKLFGAAAPSPHEQEKIDAVRAQYGFKVDRNQLAWYRWRESNKSVTRDMMDEQQPWTEEEAFVLTGMSFFQVRKISDDIDRLRDNNWYLGYRFQLGNSFLASKIEQILDPNRIREVELRVWEAGQPDGKYVIGVDPAFGRHDEADNFVISVIRCFADRWIQVAEYASNLHSAEQATWVLAYLAGRYRNAMVNLEINGPGDQVMMVLNNLRRELRAKEYNAEKGFEAVSEDMLDTMRWYLYHRPDSMGPGWAYNFQTTQRTKYPLMSGFRDSYSNDMAQINSVACLREMYTVTQEGREIGAMGDGQKDDRVVALALADWGWKEWIRPSQMFLNQTYEREMKLQNPQKMRIQDKINMMIAQTLAKPEPEPPVNKFLADRGLLA